MREGGTWTFFDTYIIIFLPLLTSFCYDMFRNIFFITLFNSNYGIWYTCFIFYIYLYSYLYSYLYLLLYFQEVNIFLSFYLILII